MTITFSSPTPDLRRAAPDGPEVPRQVPPLSPFWLAALATVVGVAWLIPNHYPPWSAFHADAWIAVALTLASAAVILRSDSHAMWHWLAMLVAVLACIPGLQFAFGLIPFAGQAWISAAYILGLLLALLTGQRWEQSAPDQCAGGLFLGIGVASVLSVCLQLQTWLGLVGTGLFDFWSMGLAGERPYANIGQPNQLATLLLWGLLAIAWGFAQCKIRAGIAIAAASFLLVGIALTQSRTAWLGLTFLVAATWYWRNFWSSRWVPWVVSSLFVFFWTCPLILKLVTDALLLGSTSYIRSDFQGENRHLALRLFAQAALERPWFGYGWSEVGLAQLAVATEFPALHMAFGHSHNLFVDLILWLGLPAGIFVSLALVAWLVMRTRATRTASDAILIMFLGVVGIHAMVELPLHYAYFLLPAGLVVGVLSSRTIDGTAGQMSWSRPRWTLIAVWLVASLLLVTVVRDYFQVEANFQALRFELARIGNLPKGKPPDVVLLTQLRERINLMRYEVKTGMSADELAWLLQLANANPGAGVLHKAATALALNHRPEEAGLWLHRACKVSTAVECDLIMRVWTSESSNNPLIAAVSWPN